MIFDIYYAFWALMQLDLRIGRLHCVVVTKMFLHISHLGDGTAFWTTRKLQDKDDNGWGVCFWLITFLSNWEWAISISIWFRSEKNKTKPFAYQWQYLYDPSREKNHQFEKRLKHWTIPELQRKYTCIWHWFKTQMLMYLFWYYIQSVSNEHQQNQTQKQTWQTKRNK